MNLSQNRMNLFTKQKQIHRCIEQTYDCGVGEWGKAEGKL